jgi:succinyl-CoA synthetase beta subunit
MDLLEYQAKDLFRQVGIPVLPSQHIAHPSDLKSLTIPFPVVLKAQVYGGQRAGAGGIRFAENTIDAVAATQAIFSLPINGQYPDVVLAEAMYHHVEEYYVAIALDTSTRRPVLLGLRQGGSEVESTLQPLHQVIVDQEFSPFYARRLAIEMGLEGALIQAVSDVLERMYSLFTQKDLDLIEINPLAVSAKGQLMALDAKVAVNSAALGRHPELKSLQDEVSPPEGREGTAPSGLELVMLDGNIGILCNGAGLTMTTLDLIVNNAGNPACFLNLGSEVCHNAPADSFRYRLEWGLNLMMQNRNIDVVLINLINHIISCSQIAEAIAASVRRRMRSRRPLPQIVVRLLGHDLPQAAQTLEKVNVVMITDLDTAIAETVALS